jgi:histidinol-phosphate phosphatase family protein
LPDDRPAYTRARDDRPRTTEPALSFDVVIPTAGRPSLQRLLCCLEDARGPAPARVIVVDDRRQPDGPLKVTPGVECIAGPARGPAAARNAGWRAATADWVAFLDDDVLVPCEWPSALERDLAELDLNVAASQGRIVVPLGSDRPTDWERNVQGLESARWATADMAFRRAALALVGGFDERFPRAYREDSDLALRLLDAGLALRRGRRHVIHPVCPASRWVSVSKQAGNADDALMRALHGRHWRERAGAPPGRLPRHALTTLALSGTVLAPTRALRALSTAAWFAGTADFAWARIAPGPRTPNEVATMAATSALIPPVAVWHRVRGQLRARRPPEEGRPVADPAAMPPLAVLVDRDDTLIEDVPYNGEPARVRPLPGVRAALDRLRAAGVRLAVVSNQSGIGRGWLTEHQVKAVNARVEELLGPFDAWLICPHAPGDGCDCRKPAPGLVLAAARRLGVAPCRCALIGDIGADVEAARAAGARPVLVPTARTRAQEVADAPERAATFSEAVDRLLGERGAGELRAAA